GLGVVFCCFSFCCPRCLICWGIFGVFEGPRSLCPWGRGRGPGQPMPEDDAQGEPLASLPIRPPAYRRGAVAEPVSLPIASRYCTLPSRIRSTVPVIRPLRSRGALRCAQRDLTRGAFGNLPSCFARRAASVSNDRAILSNFFLTRASVAWLAKFRHFSAICRYSKPFRILALSGIAKPRHGATVAGFWRS